MPYAVNSSNDLIDDLVRSAFGVEPDVMAVLAHTDEHVTLRRLPMMEPTSDPLDGVEVLVRLIIATTLAMRQHEGPVALVTEHQARAAGWPTARLANTALVLAWALALTEPHEILPVLVEAEADDQGPSPLVRADDPLPSFETLLGALRRTGCSTPSGSETPAGSRLGTPAAESRRLVSLDTTLRTSFGIDAATVELPSDGNGWGTLTSANARAAGVLAWIGAEALETADVMAAENLIAVRLKSERDARLAGGPGASAANVALLLGAAIHHGAGTTAHVLPSTDDVADALVEAGGRAASRRNQATDDYERQTVDILELSDLAARGYIHVGRRAARQVASRLLDGRSATVVGMSAGGERAP